MHAVCLAHRHLWLAREMRSSKVPCPQKRGFPFSPAIARQRMHAYPKKQRKKGSATSHRQQLGLHVHQTTKVAKLLLLEVLVLTPVAVGLLPLAKQWRGSKLPVPRAQPIISIEHAYFYAYTAAFWAADTFSASWKLRVANPALTKLSIPMRSDN